MGKVEGELRLARRLARRLGPLAVAIGLQISLIPPACYYLLESKALRTTATNYGRELAGSLQDFVLESPKLWMYQVQKYFLVLHGFLPYKEITTIRVLDEKGQSITQYEHDAAETKGRLNLHVQGAASPVLFNNRRVGEVRVDVSLDSVLINTLLFLFVSTTIGAFLSLLIYRFPVKIAADLEGQVHELMGTLRRAHDELEVRVRERTAELRETNEVLEREITERRRAEQSLRESESKFRRLSQEFHTLLDAIPDRLVLLSPDLKVLWSNNGAARALGRDNADLRGQHCYELWHRRSSACKECPAARSFRTGKEESAQMSTHEGRTFEVRAFPIKDDHGKVDNVIEIGIDVTEKMKLQAEAMHAAHLASLGELAAGVAHEVNNPINSIINYAQILLDESNGESAAIDLYRRILRSSDRIANIVRSLLSFARASDQEKAVVRLDELLENSLTLTGTQARKEGITLKTSIPRDLPDIMAHPQQLEQVFLNIISNARYALNQKYPGTHADKILEISAEEVTVPNGPYVRMTFYDRGSGIPADVREKVLDPFFSTKPRGIGTGLGLSISHGIVTDHGGRLTIDSVEGEFTKIVLDLPVGRED